MVQIQLSDPQLTINGQAIKQVPNSFKWIDGNGEFSYRVHSAGGGNVEGVISKNVETQKSGFKFQLFLTNENLELVNEWKRRFGDNAAQVTDGADPNFSRSFNNAVFMNDPEFDTAFDSTFEIECCGDPAI